MFKSFLEKIIPKYNENTNPSRRRNREFEYSNYLQEDKRWRKLNTIHEEPDNKTVQFFPRHFASYYKSRYTYYM